jgi:hypothetical protein
LTWKGFGVKKLIYSILALLVVFILVLNSSILADQAVDWVKENPKDPDAPVVLFRAARWCNILGDENKALAIYWQIYQEYPEKSELCAPAMYYSAEIKANGSNIVAFRKQALPYLDILMNQYSSQEEWRAKGKIILDEVNYVH